MSQNPHNHGQQSPSEQPRYGQRLPEYGETSSSATPQPRYGVPETNYGHPRPDTPQTGAPDPRAGVPIPPKVMLSFRLMIGAAVVFILANAYTIFLTATGQMDEQLREAVQTIEEVMGGSFAGALPLGIDQLRQQQVIGNAVLAVIVGGLFVLVAILIKRGFGAGRIIATICAVLTILAAISFPDFLWWLTGLVATIFAWSKEATQYNQAAARARAQAKFGQWTGK
ncbi:hypothetical protein [Micrococcoides hystricis]|uniref:DUF4064 domain-containing protein n=1 Tax=Micrococcoides hystricis TaxID=1572761 RepID=A0ABV6PD74_9MICC